MSSEQQAFTLGEPLRDAFRRFCEDQGFDRTLVFLAGWRALDKADEESRKHWFASLPPWQDEIMEKWGPNGEQGNMGGKEAAG